MTTDTTALIDVGEKLTRAVKDDWAGRIKTVKEPKDPTLPSKPRRTRQRAPLPVRPNLERLERTGPQMRDAPHATPDDIIEMFAVRGVEFGNWVKPAERQANVTSPMTPCGTCPACSAWTRT